MPRSRTKRYDPDSKRWRKVLAEAGLKPHQRRKRKLPRHNLGTWRGEPIELEDFELTCGCVHRAGGKRIKYCKDHKQRYPKATAKIEKRRK